MSKRNEIEYGDLMPLFNMALTVMGEMIQKGIDSRMTEKPQEKLFYNLKELEVKLGITYLGLKGRIKRGTLKAVKNGNTWLVSADEVERFIGEMERKKGGV